ncbi:hypothetical protein [Insolitispirillum peregrinum]|uniref:hypothetical protein n=1 Tax=Insolitispirillum peregrinum TaxID=80876 RepID=UPI003622131F
MSGSNTIISIPGGGCCPQPPDLDSAVRRVADQMHRLNHAIVQAVEAGATIELLRCSRHHAGNGRWGDQMQPIVTVTEQRPA